METKSEYRKTIDNCFNEFMVMYFRQGFSYVEASEKAMANIEELFDYSEPVEELEEESKEEVEANQMGHPLDE